MPPCHVTPFQRPGITVIPTLDNERSAAPAAECCDYCASPQLEWRKCKLICTNCRQINKSCADL
jgi:hypothetical protein